MERKVRLRIVSAQQYVGEEPEQTELLTEGVLQECDGTWRVSYRETELTGLQGTTTCFEVSRDRIVLTRTGALQSQMVFAIGQEHHSLYDMGFGALMIVVRTQKLTVELSADGGMFEVQYALCIENSTAGQVSYRIEVTP